MLLKPAGECVETFGERERESVDHSGVFVDKTCEPMTGSTLRADLTDSTGHPASGSIRVAEERGRCGTQGEKVGCFAPQLEGLSVGPPALDEADACCSSARGQHMVESAAINASQLALATSLTLDGCKYGMRR